MARGTTELPGAGQWTFAYRGPSETEPHRLEADRPIPLNWGDATIYSGSTLLFADMYTLGGGVALFPRPDQCHALPAGSVLRITGRRRIRLEGDCTARLETWGIQGGALERTLSQSAALRVRSRFRPDSTIKLVIDSINVQTGRARSVLCR